MVHFFFFNDPATTEIYTYLHPLSLHDALPIYGLTTGRVSAPANTGRGEILGVEATLDLPFRALTSALDGFGVFATGHYTYSSIKFANNPIEAITLPGLSKRSEEHTSELQSLMRISYAVFCLKKTKPDTRN